MNKKQKIIVTMWKNYAHNCKVQRKMPLYNYRKFRWSYITEDIESLLEEKEWYKSIRI